MQICSFRCQFSNINLRLINYGFNIWKKHNSYKNSYWFEVDIYGNCQFSNEYQIALLGITEFMNYGYHLPKITNSISRLRAVT